MSGWSLFKTKSVNFSLNWNRTGGITVVMAMPQQVSCSFFCDVQLIECYTVLVHLWHHHFPHLHNTKMQISLKQKKIFQKGQRHSSLLWKAFHMNSNYFLLHRHLNVHHTLCSPYFAKMHQKYVLYQFGLILSYQSITFNLCSIYF